MQSDDSSSKSFAERDPRFARLAESTLRLRTGAVSPEVLDQAKAAIAHSSEYPWEIVVGLILDDPVDPSDLFNRGLQLQREDVERDPSAVPSAVAAPVAPKPQNVSALREARPVANPGVRPAPAAAASGGAPRGPVRKKKASPMKVFLAILIVKGTFYLIAAGLFLTMLILMREEFPITDIYEAPGRISEWFKGVFGGG
ncbi:MAG: hypothetical protein AAF196_09585 [Planctomycetota bacterium]